MTSKALLYFQLLKYYVQYTKNPEKRQVHETNRRPQIVLDFNLA